MAYYALINEKNIVVQVIAGNQEGSYNWEKFYENETGYKCKRTSYNTLGGIHRNGGEPFRKNYAGIGYTFNEQRDAFIPPKPYNSWVLNEQSCTWQAPISAPNDGKYYSWDEPTLSWKIVEEK